MFKPMFLRFKDCPLGTRIKFRGDPHVFVVLLDDLVAEYVLPTGSRALQGIYGVTGSEQLVQVVNWSLEYPGHVVLSVEQLEEVKRHAYDRGVAGVKSSPVTEDYSGPLE